MRMDNPKVVIIGAGFGGLWAAKALANSQVDVLVLDRNNYHTFFPLLYQVAAAEIEPEDIVYPIRSILRKHKRVRFLMNEVTEVDLENKQVITNDHQFPYDYLILALGSSSHFFGVTGAAENALQLKSLEQAVALRNHILYRFERALCETDAQKRQRMLTFTIVGGGPTGVEFSGALSELISGSLANDYPQLNFKEEGSILLLEAADHLLTGMPARLQEYALTRLRRKGVDVRLGAAVQEISAHTVQLKDGTVIPTETVVWTAGVRGVIPPHSGDLPEARGQRLKVLSTLQVPDHPEVYVAGDLAYFEEHEHALPGVAPVAMQEAEMAAHNILRQVKGEAPLPFEYHDPGTMVTIGRNTAAVQIGKHSFTGFIAWILWLTVHLYKLIGFRNRLMVLINWAWSYLFFEHAQRLIIPVPGKGQQIPQESQEPDKEKQPSV